MTVSVMKGDFSLDIWNGVYPKKSVPWYFKLCG